MRIGIIGTRGIPNNYGGFEQFAEYLSQGLVAFGCEVYVYNSHNHPFQEQIWEGVHIIHKYDPEFKYGTMGQFIYDLNCIKDSRKRKFDIILQLGYTSSSIWGSWLPSGCKVITNMDGIEYSRKKYNWAVKQFLKYAEKLAVKYSERLVADSVIIKKHIEDRYRVEPVFIPYGADEFKKPDSSCLTYYGIEPGKFFLLIARLQPDNNIEPIIRGVLNSNTTYPILIIGNHNNSFGSYLHEKYSSDIIKFAGSVYDIAVLNNLRYYSYIYFHGHSAGGTNPSLLEAMASSALICANENPFNRGVLGKNAFYFSCEEDITKLINSHPRKELFSRFIDDNLTLIKEKYHKKQIIHDYYTLFCKELGIQ